MVFSSITRRVDKMTIRHHVWQISSQFRADWMVFGSSQIKFIQSLSFGFKLACPQARKEPESEKSLLAGFVSNSYDVG